MTFQKMLEMMCSTWTVTYITEVVSVYSGLDEEGVVWGQIRLELYLFVFCLIVQLQKE